MGQYIAVTTFAGTGRLHALPDRLARFTHLNDTTRLLQSSYDFAKNTEK